jgi:hypothetical protein
LMISRFERTVRLSIAVYLLRSPKAQAEKDCPLLGRYWGSRNSSILRWLLDAFDATSIASLASSLPAPARYKITYLAAVFFSTRSCRMR